MVEIKENKLDIRSIIRIGGILCIICAAVALILSFVNNVTAERIRDNEEMEKKSAIISLFDSDSIEYKPVDFEYEGVNELYSVTDGGLDRGYCVSASPMGFGGGINIMVGIDPAGNVIGVRIVSHSETPGLGSRIENDSFLSQFAGKNGALGDGVDIISGSTISSEAVSAGVDTALAALNVIFTGGVVN